MQVRVEGLAELRAALRSIDRKLPAQLGKVGKAIGDRLVAPEARRRVPRRTGRLAESIKAGGTQKGGYVKVGAPAVDPVPLYAPVIHYGWRAHNIEPQPFLTDAIEAKTDEIVDAYAGGLDTLIREVGLDE